MQYNTFDYIIDTKQIDHENNIVTKIKMIIESLNNINNIKDNKIFNLGKKYNFLDKIFLKVVKNHPEKMPEIFYKMFKKTLVKPI